jgi:AcrR family transcriptional regulator
MKVKVTKDKIIAAAWQLLVEEGSAGFSMRKLAKLVAMTVSSLYYHFPSKESIFAELINEASTEFVFPVANKSWQDRLSKFADNILVVLNKYPNLAQLLMEYPPTSINYLKLVDNLLMVVESIELDFNKKFYFINQFLNYIFTFKVDSERFDNKQEVKESGIKTNALPFLNYYREQGVYDSLGSQEMFTFGIQIMILGFEQLEKAGQQ